MYNKSGRILYCHLTAKRCYTVREAGRILNSVKRHKRNSLFCKSKDLPRRKYYCHDCGYYHLTHMPFFDISDIKNDESLPGWGNYVARRNVGKDWSA